MANQCSDIGRVIFESQGPLEDAIHQLEYARVLIDGSQWVHPSAFRNWLEPGCRFQPKSGSDPGEIADMFARDLFEWIRGDCLSEPRRFELFSRKIYCREDGAMGKFGIKVFPDSDIRDNVLKHREKCGAVFENEAHGVFFPVFKKTAKKVRVFLNTFLLEGKFPKKVAGSLVFFGLATSGSIGQPLALETLESV